jgi:hypothetical protein
MRALGLWIDRCGGHVPRRGTLLASSGPSSFLAMPQSCPRPTQARNCTDGLSARSTGPRCHRPPAGPRTAHGARDTRGWAISWDPPGWDPPDGDPPSVLPPLFLRTLLDCCRTHRGAAKSAGGTLTHNSRSHESPPQQAPSVSSPRPSHFFVSDVAGSVSGPSPRAPPHTVQILYRGLSADRP